MQSTKLIVFSVAEILAAAWFGFMFVYAYPWLYNMINKFTKRGPDLHENIDFVNSMLMFIVPSVLLLLFKNIRK